MLSFDCTPSFMFQDQFAGFDFFAPQERARVVRPQRDFQEYSPRRQVQLQRHQDPFEQLFKLCDTRAHRAPPVEHHSRVVPLNDSYQIQVLKRNNPSNSFEDYEINYKVTDGNTFISIQSQGDDFQKTFAFQTAGIDIKKIGWRTVENVLVVDVPKKVETKKELNRDVHKDHKKGVMPIPVEELHTSKAESKSHSKKEHKKKEHKKEHKKRAISIPITFGHFEDDVQVRSNQSSQNPESVSDSELAQLSDSELSTCSSTHELSDAEESMPSPKLPKLTRKVSLEEVEDESLHQMDLD